jgi:hypothetical protein
MLSRTVTRFLLAALAVLLCAVSAQAATGTVAPFPKHQFFDANGNPCNGCLLFTYTSGTSTKVNTYTESGLGSANTNPIVLDSAGRATIFLTPGVSYKFVLAPSTDTDPPASPTWTVDGVNAVPPASTASDNDVACTAGATIAAGEVVYISDGSGGTTAGRCYLADSDQTYSSTAARIVGMATAAISTGSSGTIRVSGRVTGLTGLVAGTAYFVSATAGALTSTAPTNARALGTADSTTSFVIAPWAGTVEASSSTAGLVSTGTQTLAGAKTFPGAITASGGVTWASTSSTLNFAYAKTSANFTKNANTTLGDVTGLSFSVAANETWVFRVVMYEVSATAADWKVAVTGPAAATANFAMHSSMDTPGAARTTSYSTGMAVGGSAVDDVMVMEGIIINGANAGTVQIQAAQNSSDASNSIIYANSFLVAWRVQ